MDDLFNEKMRMVVEYMQYREFSSDIKRKVRWEEGGESGGRGGETGGKGERKLNPSPTPVLPCRPWDPGLG